MLATPLQLFRNTGYHCTCCLTWLENIADVSSSAEHILTCRRKNAFYFRTHIGTMRRTLDIHYFLPSNVDLHFLPGSSLLVSIQSQIL